MKRVLLVGESNPYGDDPRLALLPAGSTSRASASRLVRILGWERREFLRTFDRVNLLKEGKWDRAEARQSANRLKHWNRVLLGARVAEAHGLAFTPFKVWHSHRKGRRSFRALILPHPSGRCRVWNDPVTAVRARIAVELFLREAR